MYVQHVAAGEHARDGGLHVFVYDRAVRARVHLNIRAAAQLVLRDQTDRQQDRVAVEGHFGARDRTAVRADLGNDDALHAVLALNVRNGVGEIKRNVKVIEALHDVSRQTAGIRHDLDAGEHLRALERHAARHDETDVARAENDDAPADHVALDIKVALCSAGGENACRTGARDGDRAAGALAAAHREDDGLCLKVLIAALGGDDVNVLVRGDVQHHGVQTDVHAGLAYHVDKAAGILRAGQLFLEIVQTEAVVDALV